MVGFMRIQMAALSFFVTAGLCASPIKLKINNIDELRDHFRLSSEYKGVSAFENLKIAILDSGFAGNTPTPGGKLLLPPGALLIASYGKPDAPALDASDGHGTQMAQIVWGMMGYPEPGPQMRLYNANGPDNFVDAVGDLVAWKADIVVFSRNWETFGNFDGTGFIDEAVRTATESGVIWLNAAGNYHELVYNGAANIKQYNDEAFVVFGSESKDWYLPFSNAADENEVSITLSWNSFGLSAIPTGTNKDLDLLLYRQAKDKATDPILIASSELRQVVANPDAKKGETLFPRERITVKLPASKDFSYLLSIKKVGGTFDPRRDRIRVSISSSKPTYLDPATHTLKKTIKLKDATGGGEIMVPGDGTGLAIGDVSPIASRGPTIDGRGKPEIILDRNQITFSDQRSFYGTSYATAILGGIVAVLKAQQPALRQSDLLKFRTAAASGAAVQGSGDVDEARVTDGSENDPKFWETPSLSRLREVVELQ